MSKNQVTFKSNIQTHISVISPEGETRSQDQGSLIGMVFSDVIIDGVFLDL